jgi:hypothetical protein
MTMDSSDGRSRTINQLDKVQHGLPPDDAKALPSVGTGGRMPQLVAFDEEPDPVNISLFGAQAIVLVTNSLAHFVQQAGRVQLRKGGGVMAGFSTKYFHRILRRKPHAKGLCGLSARQIRPQAPDFAGAASRSTLR